MRNKLNHRLDVSPRRVAFRPERSKPIDWSRLLADERFHLFLVFTTSFLLLFARLREGGLGGYDDAFYAHKGRQMLETGSWWIAYNDGYWEYAQPLLIWLEAISFAVLGITDFAARVLPALTGLGTILLVYVLARQLRAHIQPRTQVTWWPVFSALVLVFTPYFLKYATHAMADVPFTFITTAALLFYIKGLERPKHWLIFGALSGLGLLTRSVIGLFPLGIAGAHLVLTGRGRRLYSPFFLTAVALALAMAASWYVPNYRVHGQAFLKGAYALIKNQVGSTQPQTAWHYLKYFKHMAYLYWPWLPFLIAGFAMSLGKAVKARDGVALFLILWVLAVVVPLSLAQAKVLRYLIPAFPAFSLLAAYPLTVWFSETGKQRLMKILSVGLYVGLLIYIALPMNVHTDRACDMRALAPIARQIDDPEQPVIFYFGGNPLRNRVNEFVWYSNRPAKLLLDSNELLTALNNPERQVFILDKNSYNQLRLGREIHHEFIQQSGEYVCITNAPGLVRRF